MVPSIISFLGKVIGVSLLVITIVAIGGNILVHHHQIQMVSEHSWDYSYAVSVTGLSGYRGDPITEIVLPLPAVGDSPIFSGEDLRWMTSDNCTTLPVTTEDGEMLGLRLPGADLTDASAAHSGGFLKDLSREEIAEGGFVPGLSHLSKAGNASPYIIIPDSLRPVSDDPEPILASINFTVFGGRTSGEQRPDYLISIMEQIPPGKTGIIPVEPQVYHRDSFREAFRPLEENDSVE